MSKSAYIYLFFLTLVAVLGFRESNAKLKKASKNLHYSSNHYDLAKIKSGDIIFQTSQSTQSKAIQLATQSKYSHVGIVFKNNDNYFVLEAVQPVKLTPLNEWILRGEKSHFVIKRLKGFEQTVSENKLDQLKKAGEKYIGKNYDYFFEWSDDKIYCSELVWKMYHEVLGVRLGELQNLSEFDLSNPIVKEKLKERYGSKIPSSEKVISPAQLFNSELLETIIVN